MGARGPIPQARQWAITPPARGSVTKPASGALSRRLDRNGIRFGHGRGWQAHVATSVSGPSRTNCPARPMSGIGPEAEVDEHALLGFDPSSPQIAIPCARYGLLTPPRAVSIWRHADHRGDSSAGASTACVMAIPPLARLRGGALLQDEPRLERTPGHHQIATQTEGRIAMQWRRTTRAHPQRNTEGKEQSRMGAGERADVVDRNKVNTNGSRMPRSG
jgi:hypothetical protein